MQSVMSNLYTDSKTAPESNALQPKQESVLDESLFESKRTKPQEVIRVACITRAHLSNMNPRAVNGMTVRIGSTPTRFARTYSLAHTARPASCQENSVPRGVRAAKPIPMVFSSIDTSMSRLWIGYAFQTIKNCFLYQSDD